MQRPGRRGVSSRSKFRGMRFAGLGVEFAAAVAGLTLLGYWFDRHFGTRPWALLIGAALGLIGGMYNLLRETLTAVKPPAGGPPGASGGETQR